MVKWVIGRVSGKVSEAPPSEALERLHAVLHEVAGEFTEPIELRVDGKGIGKFVVVSREAIINNHESFLKHHGLMKRIAIHYNAVTADENEHTNTNAVGKVFKGKTIMDHLKEGTLRNDLTCDEKALRDRQEACGCTNCLSLREGKTDSRQSQSASKQETEDDDDSASAASNRCAVSSKHEPNILPTIDEHCAPAGSAEASPIAKDQFQDPQLCGEGAAEEVKGAGNKRTTLELHSSDLPGAAFKRPCVKQGPKDDTQESSLLTTIEKKNYTTTPSGKSLPEGTWMMDKEGEGESHTQAAGSDILCMEQQENAVQHPAIRKERFEKMQSGMEDLAKTAKAVKQAKTTQTSIRKLELELSRAKADLRESDKERVLAVKRCEKAEAELKEGLFQQQKKLQQGLNDIKENVCDVKGGNTEIEQKLQQLAEGIKTNSDIGKLELILKSKTEELESANAELATKAEDMATLRQQLTEATAQDSAACLQADLADLRELLAAAEDREEAAAAEAKARAALQQELSVALCMKAAAEERTTVKELQLNELRERLGAAERDREEAAAAEVKAKAALQQELSEALCKKAAAEERTTAKELQLNELRERLAAAQKDTVECKTRLEIFQEEKQQPQPLSQDELASAITAAISKTHIVCNPAATGGDMVERSLLTSEQAKNKILRNEIECLKGNLRVIARIRPISSKEAQDGMKVAVTAASDGVVAYKLNEKSHRREFTSAFGPEATQASLFGEVKPLVHSAVDGYNVCIFAYGQTGSGKTFTMSGTDSHPGLTPRLIMEVFSLIEASRGSGITFIVECSVLEIYNEVIHDMLSPPAGQKPAQQGLTLREDKGRFTVPDATSVVVQSAEELQDVVRRGHADRTTFATKMNTDSSRSHLLTRVTIVADLGSGRATRGTLSLVDLAGSERPSQSGVQGAQLKEAQHINKSLLVLGRVVNALVEKQRGNNVCLPPYRESVLTTLLKDSLGGDSKTLMFVNVSPGEAYVAESHSSLNFASRASVVRTGGTSRVASTVRN